MARIMSRISSARESIRLSVDAFVTMVENRLRIRQRYSTATAAFFACSESDVSSISCGKELLVVTLLGSWSDGASVGALDGALDGALVGGEELTLDRLTNKHSVDSCKSHTWYRWNKRMARSMGIFLDTKDSTRTVWTSSWRRDCDCCLFIFFSFIDPRR